MLPTFMQLLHTDHPYISGIILTANFCSLGRWFIFVTFAFFCVLCTPGRIVSGSGVQNFHSYIWLGRLTQLLFLGGHGANGPSRSEQFRREMTGGILSQSCWAVCVNDCASRPKPWELLFLWQLPLKSGSSGYTKSRGGIVKELHPA